MPQDWRDANITPLFKKGLRTLASNYRPISLTRQVMKILERILSDHIWEFLHIRMILSAVTSTAFGQAVLVSHSYYNVCTTELAILTKKSLLT